jgi:hypothetical protein
MITKMMVPLPHQLILHYKEKVSLLYCLHIHICNFISYTFCLAVLTPEEESMLASEVDDALAMLLSLAEVQGTEVEQALQTVHKMLSNLHTSPNEVKYRSIRVSNKAFQSKVASISGAVELLLAAGFIEVVGSEKVASSNSSTSAIAEESYLQHNMSEVGQTKLVYVLTRVQDVIEIHSTNA